MAVPSSYVYIPELAAVNLQVNNYYDPADGNAMYYTIVLNILGNITEGDPIRNGMSYWNTATKQIQYSPYNGNLPDPVYLPITLSLSAVYDAAIKGFTITAVATGGRGNGFYVFNFNGGSFATTNTFVVKTSGTYTITAKDPTVTLIAPVSKSITVAIPTTTPDPTKDPATPTTTTPADTATTGVISASGSTGLFGIPKWAWYAVAALVVIGVGYMFYRKGKADVSYPKG